MAHKLYVGNYFRGQMDKRLEFYSMPEPNSGCTLWLGASDSKGYGYVGLPDGKIKRAYAVSYELMNGPVSKGYELHHRCANPSCINPDHLEPLTRSEHQRREPRRWVGDITHCKRGHEFTPENTYITKKGRRNCRACHRLDRFGPRK